MQRLRPLVANFRRITDGNPLMQRLSITRPQKPVRYSVMETTMVMKKTLMLLAMSAVLAGSVSPRPVDFGDSIFNWYSGTFAFSFATPEGCHGGFAVGKAHAWVWQCSLIPP